MSKKTYYIIGAVVVILGVIGFFIFKSPAKSAMGNAITEQVTQADINKKITATGTIQQSQTVSLNFSTSGLKITKVNVAVGDKVKTGDVLAQADTTNLNIQLQQAEAQMNTAKAALDQVKAGPTAVEISGAQAQVAKAQADQVTAHQAYNSNPSDPIKQAALASANANLVSANATLAAKQAGPTTYDLQTKQAAFNQAQANYNQARQNIAGATIVAPWDGIVLSQNGKVGDIAGQGGSGSSSNSSSSNSSSSNSNSSGGGNSASSAIATVSGSSNAVVTLQSTSADMQVVSAIDETDISSVQVGQDVQVTVDSYPGKKFKGKVAQIAPQAVTQSNVTYFNVTISVTNENDQLKTGMNSNVAILVASKKDVLAVPSEAVKEDNNNNKYVMVFDPAAKRAQRVKVDIGIDDGAMAEVKSGLEDGNKVVIGYPSATTQSSQSKGGFGGMFGGNRNSSNRSGSGNSGGNRGGGN